MVKNISCKFYEVILIIHAQVSYRILGHEYFSASLFAENKQTKIEGVSCQLKHKKHFTKLVRVEFMYACLFK